MLLRYQAQADRLYRRAVEDFERLKKLRPESPNEAIYTFEPPPPEPYRPPQPAERCEAEGTTLTPDPRPLIPFPPDTIKTFPHTDHP
jgi:hypothetical protein